MEVITKNTLLNHADMSFLLIFLEDFNSSLLNRFTYVIESNQYICGTKYKQN